MIGKTLWIILLISVFNQPLKSENCPMHQEHSSDATHTNCPYHLAHADSVMGFNQNKTYHHFKLEPDGGSIEVRVRDVKDSNSIQQIRTHLQEVSKAFKEGNFSKPQVIHGKLPPGAVEMKKLRAQLSFTYQELSEGGRVKIETGDPNALKAVHQFLKFQIEEHQTGDPIKVNH
jgi:hypothetical protein